MIDNNAITRIAVIGLGYVGLPLAIELGKHFSLIGIDINQKRISELKEFKDSNDEVSAEELKSSSVDFTVDFTKIKEANFIIVTVPTPVNKNKKPDLTPLEISSKAIGENISKGSIVVFESTVYPGVTEEVCGPIIEKNSGLKAGIDFNLGYSPERINPGDKVHTVDKVIKVVSADNDQTLEIVDFVYSKAVKAGIFKASSIKTAEMAKVIENTQRDINIALMNEIALICHKLDINSRDVLEAAATKWNFLNFTPGLVGGHCIGVDPYYLTFKCEELNYHPQMILSGRRINDGMGKYVAEKTVKKLIDNDKTVKNANVLIMGATFKENIRDIRNSKVIDIVEELKGFHLNVFLNDPLADSDLVKKEFGLELHKLKDMKNIDAIILAVNHKDYKVIKTDFLKSICNTNPVFIDIKGFMNKKDLIHAGFDYWNL